MNASLVCARLLIQKIDLVDEHADTLVFLGDDIVDDVGAGRVSCKNLQPLIEGDDRILAVDPIS